MKYPIAILFSLLLFFLPSCKNEAREKQIIQRAETWFDTAPDSVLHILDSIPLPEEMTPSLATRWSMLYARAADKAGKEMPYVSQLQIAFKYYKNQKQWPEAAEAGLYLGRSYVVDKEYDQAMQTYTDALEIALEIDDYNRAGYICSYMGDLYEVDGNYAMAATKYEESNSYFHQADNQKSYAFGLVNEAFCYVITEHNETALSLLQKADTVATSLNDPEVKAYVYNGLGNAYLQLKNYDLAEFYIRKGIQLDSIEIAADYASLADIYYERRDKEKALRYLEKARNLTTNKISMAGIDHKYYLLNKDDENYKEALHYLEQYVITADSIVTLENSLNMMEIENKYNHLKLQNENKQLKINQQRNQIVVFSLAFGCIFLLAIYLWMLRRKNQQIGKQQMCINQQKQEIYSTSLALQKKKNELQKQCFRMEETKRLLHLQGSYEEEENKYEKLKSIVEDLSTHLHELKEERLLQSPLAKKLQKISQTVKPNHTQPLISDRYWHTIEEQVTEVYPALATQMETVGLTNAERRFCYLTLFQLDTTALSVLLNIIPESVNKQRLRVRQKFNLVGKNVDLYQYLSNF